MISTYGGLSVREEFLIWLDKNFERIKEANCDVCKQKMKSYHTPLKMRNKILVCSSECMRKASGDLAQKHGKERIGCVIMLQELLLVQKGFDLFSESYPLDHPQKKTLERLGFREGLKISSIKVLS